MVYETIIEGVRARPYIYSKTSPYYKDRQLAQKGFEEISEMIKNVWTVQLSATNIEGIWNDLFKEFKKAYEEKKFQPSGSAATQGNTFTYYDNLTFLIDEIEHRTPLSSTQKFTKNTSIWLQKSGNGTGLPAAIHKAKNLIPDLDDFAKEKINKQQDALALLANAQQSLNDSSSKFIDIMEKKEHEQPCIGNDYHKIFYEKLSLVDDDMKDDCLLAVLECLNTFIQ